MKLMAVLLLLSATAFAKTHTFKSAKLLSVGSTEHMLKGTSSRNAVYTVRVDDIIYTLEGGRISRHGSDESSMFIVGDAVQASIEDDKVVLVKPDGKDTKTTIMKRERAVK